MATRTEGFSHITSDPAIQGGAAVLAGTRLPVRAVVLDWREPHDRRRIVQNDPQLTPELLDEVIADYTAHRAETQAELRAEDEAEDPDNGVACAELATGPDRRGCPAPVGDVDGDDAARGARDEPRRCEYGPSWSIRCPAPRAGGAQH